MAQGTKKSSGLKRRLLHGTTKEHGFGNSEKVRIPAKTITWYVNKENDETKIEVKVKRLRRGYKAKYGQIVERFTIDVSPGETVEEVVDKFVNKMPVRRRGSSVFERNNFVAGRGKPRDEDDDTDDSGAWIAKP